MSDQNSQSPQGQQGPPPGPPYVPQVWMLGGRPKASVDIPITAVFLGLFIISAVVHMTIFQVNMKKGHKFIMSAILFGFSMARICTCTMRIASVSLPENIRLGIAAQVFTAAGVVLLYIINLIFTQRVLRASHPRFAWHKLFEVVFKALIASIILVIAMLITVVVQSFYTLNPNIRRIDRDVQLTGSTYFAAMAFLPIPLVIFGLVLPRRHKLDKFGHGRWRTKISILLLSAGLISFGAAYRAGVAWRTPVPMTRPIPAYMHKAAFYVANFGVEIIVLYLYAILRVDRRFHIPNGARGYGSYAPDRIGEAEKQEHLRDSAVSGDTLRINSEEEIFDRDEYAEAQKQEQDVENAQSPVESTKKDDSIVSQPEIAQSPVESTKKEDSIVSPPEIAQSPVESTKKEDSVVRQPEIAQSSVESTKKEDSVVSPPEPAVHPAVHPAGQ